MGTPRSTSRWIGSVGFLVFALLLSVSPASGAVCDLTSAGASCGPSIFTNAAIFQQVSPQPTGSGVIDSFVRVQANGIEQGYNTDFRPVQFDENTSPIFTRSLLLSSVPIVNVGGINYRQFLLDINEPNGGDNELLSLDELRFYLGASGNLTGYNAGTKQLAGLSAIYDLDTGTDNFIKLDYSLNSGSGSGDMFAYIPASFFTGPNQFVYLYSKFGVNFPAGAGFEEWAVLTPTQTPIPEPTSLTLLATGLLFGARQLRRKQNRR